MPLRWVGEPSGQPGQVWIAVAELVLAVVVLNLLQMSAALAWRPMSAPAVEAVTADPAVHQWLTGSCLAACLKLKVHLDPFAWAQEILAAWKMRGGPVAFYWRTLDGGRTVFQNGSYDVGLRDHGSNLRSGSPENETLPSSPKMTRSGSHAELMGPLRSVTIVRTEAHPSGVRSAYQSFHFRGGGALEKKCGGYGHNHFGSKDLPGARRSHGMCA